MCQHCTSLIDMQDVVNNSHRVQTLDDIQAHLKAYKVPHDWDTVRGEFFTYLANGYSIPDAGHHVKVKYKLYPPAPPAQDITGEIPQDEVEQQAPMQ